MRVKFCTDEIHFLFLFSFFLKEYCKLELRKLKNFGTISGSGFSWRINYIIKRLVIFLITTDDTAHMLVIWRGCM